MMETDTSLGSDKAEKPGLNGGPQAPLIQAGSSDRPDAYLKGKGSGDSGGEDKGLATGYCVSAMFLRFKQTGHGPQAENLEVWAAPLCPPEDDQRSHVPCMSSMAPHATQAGQAGRRVLGWRPGFTEGAFSPRPPSQNRSHRSVDS